MGRATAISIPGVLLAMVTLPAWGHAFGARYDLPLPLTLFLLGAACAVVLSFLVVEFAGRPRVLEVDTWVLPGAGRVGHVVAVVLQCIAVLLLALVVAAGLTGTQSATRNFATAFVWIHGWVGMAFVQVLVGDVWRVVNPWAAVARWTGAAMRFGGVRYRPRDYPDWLGYWPAIAIYLGIAWLELVVPASEQPRTLAWLILVYSLATWLGMSLFGVSAWVRQADGISVYFSLLGRFGCGFPNGKGGWSVRPWAAGLLDARPVAAAELFFVLCILATVSLDGFMETVAWEAVLDWVVASPLHDPLLWLQVRDVDVLALVQSVALLIAPLAMLTVYLACCHLMARVAGGTASGGEVARRFVLTLVPIAIGYHVAHYLSYLLLAGQFVVPLLSDPFGLGWDLFGTAGYHADVTLMTTQTAWYTALVAVIVGHAYAVWLAHRVAHQVFPTGVQARRSQLPLVVLMVVYTMVSLWILSQPLVSA